MEQVPLRQLELQQIYTFTYAGNLNPEAMDLRMYNDSGKNRKIKYVRASVGESPTGKAVIIDVLKNGKSIFAITTPTNKDTNDVPRPTILPGSSTDKAEPRKDVVWASDEYLTITIQQIGSSFAGADLTINVVVSE